MLSAVEWALALVALLAGVTGTWSPCGLSTIETLRVGGVHEGGRTTALGASLAFGAGALFGGVVTFGTLALIGAVVHSQGTALGSAAALTIAVGAALLEAAGVRIVPQVRRQVPEPWRRRMPVAIAAGLYGALLGLGFTTFVMTFAVWALAGMTVALAAPHVGVVVGVAFGIGRALPVVCLAPVADLEPGGRVLDSMTQRRAVLRGLRLADAGALALCALALAGPASAAPRQGAQAPSGTPAPPVFSGQVDPSVAGAQVAWEELGAGGFVALLGSNQRALPGDDPAVGGGLLAVRAGGEITIADGTTLAPLASVPAPGADQLAISAHWLVYRVPPNAGSATYAIVAHQLALPAPPGPPVVIATASAPGVLGRPALDGDTLVFHQDGQRDQVVAVDLARGTRQVVRRAATAQLLNPSVLGGQLLYVRVDDCRQQLLLGPLLSSTRDRVLASSPTQVARDGGYGRNAVHEGRTPNHCIGPLAGGYSETISYWTTALSPTLAFLTVLRASPGRTQAAIAKLPLAPGRLVRSGSRPRLG